MGLKKQLFTKFNYLFFKENSFRFIETRLTNSYKSVENVISDLECFQKCEEDSDCYAITFQNVIKNGCEFFKNLYSVFKRFGMPCAVVVVKSSTIKLLNFLFVFIKFIF